MPGAAKRTIAVAVGVAVAVTVAIILMRTGESPAARPGSSQPTPAMPPPAKPRRAAVEGPGPGATANRGADEAAISPAEKAARVEKIKKDYEEIRAKTAADYSAAGARFPGGLNAFLRQLALLEREKRADLAAVLSPHELEDLELRETLAGQQIQRWLGDTPVSDEQRRAVFRLQREFDDRFALTFDVTPKALLERETARHRLQEEIRGLLGDALFASWLRGEGPDYANFVAFATREGLPAEMPLNLWRTKNEFIRRRLELAAQPLSSPQLAAAQNALARDIETRVLAIVGPAAMVTARKEILNWLPLR